MTTAGDHKQTIRDAFTLQTDSYASSARIADAEGRRAFVEFVAPPSSALVLDVATGPGFLARAFAARTARVAALDITPSMLARARSDALSEGVDAIGFTLGDAERLPFPDATFDIVTCGSAFHHFPEPERVLAEMVRVLKPGGAVAISDITTSDDPARAALHNEIERLRDPSHTRALPVGEFIERGARCGLTSPRTATSRRERGLNEWVAISRTPPDVVEQVRRMLLDAIENDAAGIGGWEQDGEPRFWHTTVWYVAVKP